MEKNYSIILGKETLEKIGNYASFLKKGGKCGSNLSRILSNESPDNLNALSLLSALLYTKYPRVFAESAILGDGSDWTLTELGLLGDVSIGLMYHWPLWLILALGGVFGFRQYQRIRIRLRNNNHKPSNIHPL